MDKETKKHITTTLKSIGWEYIEQMLLDKFVYKAVDIDTEGKDKERIMAELIAEEKMAERIKQALNDIKSMARTNEKKDTIYK